MLPAAGDTVATVSDTVLRDALEAVVRGHDLDAGSARRVMDAFMDGAATPAQIAGLLTALRTKGEAVPELIGFVESLREHATRVHLEADAVDTCGTGGDGLGTFNVSTAAAIVAAGAGCAVAKHGNRSASSRCGSADVLEALGVTIAADAEGVRRCVEQAGIGFMYAPLFHPAMRHAAEPRRELGIRTVFNVLGPLANPARVRRQVLGVPDPALGEKMAAVLAHLGHSHALVVSGSEGIDELGLNGPTTMFEVTLGAVEPRRIECAEVGLAPAPLRAVSGGDAAANARIVETVLDGAPGAARDMVLLNAGAAIYVAGIAEDLGRGVEMARAAIDSGAARDRLRRLVVASAAVAA